MRLVSLELLRSQEPKLVIGACVTTIAVLVGGYGLVQVAMPEPSVATKSSDRPLFYTTREAEAASERRLGFADAALRDARVETRQVTSIEPAQSRDVETLEVNAADAIVARMAGADPTYAAPTRPERRSALTTTPNATSVTALRAGVESVATAPAPPPSVEIELPRQKGVVRASIPIDLDLASTRNHKVLVGRVPFGVSFSRGQQTSLGMWQMRVHEFPGVQIVVDPAAPPAFQLTVMLLDPAGTVVNGLDVSFRQANSATVAPSVDAVPPVPTVNPAQRKSSVKSAGSAPRPQAAERRGNKQQPLVQIERPARNTKPNVAQRTAQAPIAPPVAAPPIRMAAPVVAPPVRIAAPVVAAGLFGAVKPWAPVSQLKWPE